VTPYSRGVAARPYSFHERQGRSNAGDDLRALASGSGAAGAFCTGLPCHMADKAGSLRFACP
jgi:hypothetical protein